MIVLDASALLAYMFKETGHECVARYIDDACISSVNLSEVAGRLVRDGVDASLFMQKMTETTIEVVPFSEIHALYAANLIPQTRRYGLSLGDRACLALAQERHLVALTADSIWLGLTDVEVMLVR